MPGPEKLHSLFQIFKQAIEDERAAQAMYKKALSLSDDPFMQQVLRGLYEDELRHEQILLERYNALRPLVSDPEENQVSGSSPSQ